MQNDYKNPVGSIQDTYVPATTSDYIQPAPTTSDEYQVVGKGGKVRHTGTFSPDNPAFQQLQTATDNQDKDALYEKAVQWEIDNANTERQHAYEQAMRDEQREYDSPLARIARERVAGINSDLTGGGTSAGGSSSSAPMSISPRINTPTQTKFSNKYDTTAQVFDGISAVASAVSALSSAGGTIMQGISSMTMLPIQRRIQSVTANVAEQTAGSVISSSKSSAAESALNIVDKSTMLVGRLAGIITPDVSDEEGLKYLQGTGIEDPKGTLDLVRFHQKNPGAQADYQAMVKRNNELSAYNKHYTPNLLSAVHGATAVALMYQKDTEVKRERFSNSLAKLVTDNQSYLENTANSMLNGAQSSALESETNLMKAKQSNRSYINYIALLSSDVQRVQEEYDNLDPNDPNYQTQKDALDYRLTSLMTVGTESVNAYIETMRDYFVAQSMNEQYLVKTSDGELEYSDLLDVYAHTFYLNYSFDKFVSGGISPEVALKHSEWILVQTLLENQFEFDVEAFNKKLEMWGLEKGIDIVNILFGNKGNKNGKTK